MKNNKTFYDNITNLLKDGLIVSCYADNVINSYMNDSDTMARVAKSCVAGGAKAIRTNLEHIKAIKNAVDVPVIGIKKIYKNKLSDSFRITPTMKEVDLLVKAGADAIAIDGTNRERYDNFTLEQFIHSIKVKYPFMFIIADISTFEEGIKAIKYGADAVGTTLAGYTATSKDKVLFGTIPNPDPDYQIIADLKNAGIEKIIAEGRINDGYKMKKCFEKGAYAVVIGTSITEPKKIVKTIIYQSKLD